MLEMIKYLELEKEIENLRRLQILKCLRLENNKKNFKSNLSKKKFFS